MQLEPSGYRHATITTRPRGGRFLFLVSLSKTQHGGAVVEWTISKRSPTSCTVLGDDWAPLLFFAAWFVLKNRHQTPTGRSVLQTHGLKISWRWYVCKPSMNTYHKLPTIIKSMCWGVAGRRVTGYIVIENGIFAAHGRPTEVHAMISNMGRFRTTLNDLGPLLRRPGPT